MTDKALTLLGFAAKAGKLSYGMDAAKTALKQNKSRLILSAEDVSPKSQKEAAFFAEKNNTRFVVAARVDIFTLSKAVGRKCGIVSVNDSGFADALLKAVISEGVNANDK